MFPDHPPPGQTHPWNDPLEPPNAFVPRPDWALNQAGPAASPRPDDFPFTEEGRRDYYAAAERSANLSMMMMMQHEQMTAAQQAAAQYANAAVTRQRAATAGALLLLF